MGMEFILSSGLWIGATAFFGIAVFLLMIFFIMLFKKTHVGVELKAFFTNTPIGIFFKDNKFAEWKPITSNNGIVYDMVYGPFIVSTTYVDKRTKNIIIPFDVDMDGDRTTNVKELIHKFKNVTTNEKNISNLRSMISNQQIEKDKYIRNVTSHIKYGDLKNLFFSTGPHSIKSKIEKMVSEKLVKMGNVNVMQAIMIFGAIFGIIVLGAILLKTAGGV